MFSVSARKFLYHQFPLFITSSISTRISVSLTVMEHPLRWIIILLRDLLYQRLSRIVPNVFLRFISLPLHGTDVDALLDYSSSEEPNDGPSSPGAYDNSNNIPHTIASLSPATTEDVPIQPSPLKELPDNPLLEVGSMVEVDVEKAELYGVIRWIGPLHSPGTSSSNTRVMVGVELEDEPMEPNIRATDGSYNGVK